MAEDIKKEERKAQELDAQELGDSELDDVSGGRLIRLDCKPAITDAGPGAEKDGEGCGTVKSIGGPKNALRILPVGRKRERYYD